MQTSRARTERLRLKDPSHWSDIRKSKTNPRAPDNLIQESLWMDGSSNPDREEMEEYCVVEGMHNSQEEVKNSAGCGLRMLSLEEALPSLEEGLLPHHSVGDLARILHNCRKKKDRAHALRLHAHMRKSGLEAHRSLGNYLVPMLVEVGSMSDAQQVFDMLVYRNEWSWNSLITGYIKCGKLRHAFTLYQTMQKDDSVNPTQQTFVALLKACAKLKDLERGLEIHAKIARIGSLETNLFVGSTLVDMYAKCGSLSIAQKVFDKLPIRDVVSWTALLAGYAEHGHGEEALKCFEHMQLEGVYPNAVTFVCSLKACGSIRAIDKGQEIHAQIERQGLLERDLAVGNTLVGMYAKCGLLAIAQQVFDKLPAPDVVSWTALITGYVEHGHGEEALRCFEQMQLKGVFPNAITFVCSLKACGSIAGTDKGRQIHAEIERKGLLEKDHLIGNTLVDMYAKCGTLAVAQQVFDKLPVRDRVSWTALMAGYAEHGQGEEALKCFEQMQVEGVFPDAVTLVCSLKVCGNIGATGKGQEIHAQIEGMGLLKENNFVGSTLVDMYVKFGTLTKARGVFDKLQVRDVVLWTSLMAGYSEHGHGEEALKCFEQMQLEGVSPDVSIFLCSLKACGSLGATNKGQEIHAEIERKGLLERDHVVGNTLVDMYAKCGSLAIAQQVFDKLRVKDVVSWSALIAGYAEHGHGEEALKCFEQMQLEGVSPNAVTFVRSLKACGNIKATGKGQEIHTEIEKTGLLEGDLVVGTALIDMYFKFGWLAIAQQVFDKLLNRDVVSWTVLIAGYAEHGHGEEALTCFEEMQQEGVFPNAVTFVCILKACGIVRATDKGLEIHAEIERKGLLERDLVVGNTLVDMYATFGWLAKAQQVFDKLPVREVVSWNTLMAGYAEHGHGEEALKCFEQMQLESVAPNAATFVFSLKACGSIGAIEKGLEIHAQIGRNGLLERDPAVGNTLVDMYAKCGSLAKAQEVFDKLLVRDVVSWNALIAAYAEHGHGGEALKCLNQMQLEGVSPDAVTFVCSLKACGSIGATDKGREIHAEIERRGLLERDLFVGSTLVDMYAKCGSLAIAQQVFDQLPVRNVVSWTALVAGYAEHGHGEEALRCFQRMQLEGVSPNAATFVCILKACSSIGAGNKGREIHVQIERQGLLERDLVVGSSLVDMYAKCGLLANAQLVFDKLPVRNVVSWNALITGYAEHGHGKEALRCFEQMRFEGVCPNAVTFLCCLKACCSIGAVDKGGEIHAEIERKGLLERDFTVGNTVVYMYAKCGSLAKAHQVFDKLPIRNVITWNALIAGYAEHGHGEEALKCFEQMRLEGVSPNAVTLVYSLKACGSIGAQVKGGEIHAEIVRKGLMEINLVVVSTLIDMYARCGLLGKAQQVFDKLTARDVVSWTALIAGYAEHGYGEEALKCFEEMLLDGVSPNAVTFVCSLKACGSIGATHKGQEIHAEIERKGLLEKDLFVGSTLVDMYAKCGLLLKAQQVFDKLPVRNVVSWNALMAAYAKHGHGEEALKCFEQMPLEGVSPNAVTFVCSLKACGSIGAADKGLEIHADIERQGLLERDLVVANTLVDMYAKCGSLAIAQQIFDKLPVRDVVSSNSLMAGYAQVGKSENVLCAFDRMLEEGLKPDPVTFIIVLNACSRTGLFSKSQMYFEAMSKDYGIAPTIEHHTCIVDLLGRAGQLGEAVGMINEMHLCPNFAMWHSVLAACRKSGNVELGKQAFRHAVPLDVKDALLLS